VDIGEIKKDTTVEPIYDPVPREPATAPEEAPLTPEEEPVPA
jgi:hypothetical protein